ncbi:MAG: transglutaminase family protein [Salaquimonas sp.]|nr:transglutaminase family protein [Salaquimonas sp.]
MLSISHTTRYRYDRPVRLGPHRLLLRPRDGHDLRVLKSSLRISPPARLHWHFDTFGNSVAHALFADPSDHLEVQSNLLIKQYERMPPLLHPDWPKASMPPDYDEDEQIDLAPFLAMEFPQEAAGLQAWLDAVFQDRPDATVVFLKALSAAIHNAFAYSRREERGTQSALTTIHRKMGSCRDFAFLFMESARLCGFAARFVTGYLHYDRGEVDDFVGGGSTHAWADVYVPEEGWIQFDPTNLIDDSTALVRVAVTRTPLQATPISGTYERGDSSFLGMDVSVNVREMSEDEHDAPFPSEPEASSLS